MAEVNVALIGYAFMGPGPQQRLAPGLEVLFPEAHSAPQGDLRARRDRREEGLPPPRLGGVGH